MFIPCKAAHTNMAEDIFISIFFNLWAEVAKLCKLERSHSPSSQCRANIRVRCATKCTSPAVSAICQPEGWCTLKTHSLPCGTPSITGLWPLLPTLARLCCDIRLCRTTQLKYDELHRPHNESPPTWQRQICKQCQDSCLRLKTSFLNCFLGRTLMLWVRFPKNTHL